MMSGRRQRFSVQAIEGVLELLIMNILLLLLVAMLGSSLNAQAKYVLGYLIRFHVIQLLLCDAAIAIPQTATALGKTKGTDYWKYSDCSQRLSVFLVAPVYTLGGLVPPS